MRLLQTLLSKLAFSTTFKTALIFINGPFRAYSFQMWSVPDVSQFLSRFPIETNGIVVVRSINI